MEALRPVGIAVASGGGRMFVFRESLVRGLVFDCTGVGDGEDRAGGGARAGVGAKTRAGASTHETRSMAEGGRRLGSSERRGLEGGL